MCTLTGVPAAAREQAAQIAAPITVSAPPTITINSSASLPQTAAAVIGPGSTNLPNTANFAFAGVGLSVRANVYPQYDVLQGTEADSSITDFTVQFYHSGSRFDIYKYPSGYGFSLWVDNIYIGTFVSQANGVGTMQAGSSANTAVLATAASSTNNFYVGYTIAITGGTGAGQVGLIASYVGSTRTATMAANWSIAPDNTSTYAICDDVHGYYSPPNGGSIAYINLNWGSVATRKITIMGQDFGGLRIGYNDSVWPAPVDGALRMLVVGDSFIADTGGPFQISPSIGRILGKLGGCQIHNLGVGGTGWVNPGTSLNFMDRIAPPTESWAFTQIGSTGGTFTLSVTYGVSTQTTAGIAYNASAATVAAALQALSNVASGAVTVGWASYYASPYLILLHGMSGATMSVNTSGLTGLTSSSFVPWLGTVQSRVPVDGAGNALPCLLYVQGSGNDFGGGYTAAQIQTNATYTAQQISKRFPTAIAIFSGIVSTSTQGGGAIGANDIAFNAAIEAAAAYLSPINDRVPFIDTYAAGIGGNGWVFGTGTIAAPTNDTNDILRSFSVSGHPTGNGHAYLAARVNQNMKTILGAV